MHYSEITAAGEAPAAEAREIDYYAGAKRIVRDGVKFEFHAHVLTKCEAARMRAISLDSLKNRRLK